MAVADSDDLEVMTEDNQLDHPGRQTDDTEFLHRVTRQFQRVFVRQTACGFSVAIKNGLWPSISTAGTGWLIKQINIAVKTGNCSVFCSAQVRYIV